MPKSLKIFSYFAKNSNNVRKKKTLKEHSKRALIFIFQKEKQKPVTIVKLAQNVNY